MDIDGATALISGSIVFGAFIFAIAYGFVQLRLGTTTGYKENSDLLEKMNKNLRQEIDDMKNQIDKQNSDIINLQAEVRMLKQQKQDLGNIMIEALRLFFEAHPEQAIEMNKKMNLTVL